MSNFRFTRRACQALAVTVLVVASAASTVGCSTSSSDGDTASGSECSEESVLAAMHKAGTAQLPATEMDASSDITQIKDAKGLQIPPRRALNFAAFEAALKDLDSSTYDKIDELVGTATVPEIRTLLSSREVTATDLVAYYVARIQRYDVGKLNSVMELDPTALLQAKAADALVAKCSQSAPMLGIPVLLKDNITSGPSTHTTAGAAALADWRPSTEATVVTNLRRSGAIVLGKANLSEWANYVDPSMPNGYSVVGGQTRNPYAGNETYGSSSGSAVAASARFAALTVGTETQGSLVMPALINSAVTIRPSGGLISQSGIIPLYARQDTAGPMAHDVTDLAYGLNAMVGPDAADPRSADAATGHKIDFVAALKIDPSVRIGIPITSVSETGTVGDQGSGGGSGDLLGDLHAQELAARKRDLALADALEAAGASVVRIEGVVSVPEGDIEALLATGFRRDLGTFLSSQKGTPLKSLTEIVAFNNEQPALRIPYGQRLLQGAVNSKMTDAQLAQRGAAVESEARRGIEAALAEQKVDVLVTTSQAYAQASTPAVAVPTGYDSDGLPQGVTLVGRYLEDAKVLSAAFAVETATHAWRPPELK